MDQKQTPLPDTINPSTKITAAPLRSNNPNRGKTDYSQDREIAGSIKILHSILIEFIKRILSNRFDKDLTWSAAVYRELTSEQIHQSTVAICERIEKDITDINTLTARENVEIAKFFLTEGSTILDMLHEKAENIEFRLRQLIALEEEGQKIDESPDVAYLRSILEKNPELRQKLGSDVGKARDLTIEEMMRFITPNEGTDQGPADDIQDQYPPEQ